MGQSKQPEYDKKELENAKNLWGKFTFFSKWSVLAICISLALMAWLLV